MLHLLRKFEKKKLQKIKNILKLQILAIKHRNIEVLRI